MTAGSGRTPASDLDTYVALLRTVRARWKTLARIVGAATVVMLVYVLIMPQSFTSRLTILPPAREASPFALQSLLQQGQGMPSLDLSTTFGFGGRPADLLVEILKSQALADSLVVQENLAAFFGIPPGRSYRFAIEPLQQATTVDIDKNSVITLTLTLSTGYFASGAEVDSVRNFTAHVANAYVGWLDRIHREKQVSRSHLSRVFIEQELVKRRAELDSAYQRLVDYQRAHQTNFIDKQMEALLNAAASVRGRLMQAEVDLSLKERDFSRSSKVLEALRAEVDALRSQYEAITSGAGKTREDYFVPFSRVPEVARDLSNLVRDVKTLEQVITYLSEQYYQDKVQEARDTPSIQTLDAAMPALQRTSPHRAVWMVMTVVFSTLFGILYIMLSAYLRARAGARSPDAPAAS